MNMFGEIVVGLGAGYMVGKVLDTNRKVNQLLEIQRGRSGDWMYDAMMKHTNEQLAKDRYEMLINQHRKVARILLDLEIKRDAGDNSAVLAARIKLMTEKKVALRAELDNIRQQRQEHAAIQRILGDI